MCYASTNYSMTIIITQLDKQREWESPKELKCKKIRKNLHPNLFQWINKAPFYIIFTFTRGQNASWISSKMHLQKEESMGPPFINQKEKGGIP